MQGEGEPWHVVCGQPFTVALELVDEFGNKYVHASHASSYCLSSYCYYYEAL